MCFLVECVENAPAWFAARVRAAMQGAGTDDQTLVRVIVSRAELDLAAIKREYERLYDKMLQSDLQVSAERSRCFSFNVKTRLARVIFD